MIRAGETLPVEGAYDPAADEAAVNAGFRAARREREAKKAGSGEAWQSKEQLEEVSFAWLVVYEREEWLIRLTWYCPAATRAE